MGDLYAEPVLRRQEERKKERGKRERETFRENTHRDIKRERNIQRRESEIKTI